MLGRWAAQLSGYGVCLAASLGCFHAASQVTGDPVILARDASIRSPDVRHDTSCFPIVISATDTLLGMTLRGDTVVVTFSEDGKRGEEHWWKAPSGEVRDALTGRQVFRADHPRARHFSEWIAFVSPSWKRRCTER